MDGKKRAMSLVGSSDGRPKDDFYPTPPEATIALLQRESFTGEIWEPACGDLSMSRVLQAAGYTVYSTDINNYSNGNWDEQFDFINDVVSPRWTTDNIVTNPPFKYAREFAERALSLTTGKVCLLCKLQFLEGQKRKQFFKNSPLKKVYVFSNRLTLTREGKPYENGGMIAFAWYVFDHSYKGSPSLDWI